MLEVAEMNACQTLACMYCDYVLEYYCMISCKTEKLQRDPIECGTLSITIALKFPSILQRRNIENWEACVFAGVNSAFLCMPVYSRMQLAVIHI